MKVCTSCKKKEWAFDSVISELARNITDAKFIEDRSAADIFLQMAPTTFAFNYFESLRTVTRLSGYRWMDKADAQWDRIRKNIAESFALVATNGELLKIGREYNENTVMIPNGVDLKRWIPRKEFNFAENICVGFCGNVSRPDYMKHKGFELVRQVCSSITGISLKVALYGERQIPHEKMLSDFYHLIDVLLLPTDGEGCSNTITEAIACGVPVITTRRAGFHAELMKHGRDIFICDKTPDSISHALRSLAEDGYLRQRISQNARKFCEENQDIRIVAKKYSDILFDCFRAAGGEVPRKLSTDREIIEKLDRIIYLLTVKSSKKRKKKNEV